MYTSNLRFVLNLVMEDSVASWAHERPVELIRYLVAKHIRDTIPAGHKAIRAGVVQFWMSWSGSERSERLRRLLRRFRRAEEAAQGAAADLARSLARRVPVDEWPLVSVSEALAATNVNAQEMLATRSLISRILGSAGHPAPRSGWDVPTGGASGRGAPGWDAPSGQRCAPATADAAAGTSEGPRSAAEDGGGAGVRDLNDLGPPPPAASVTEPALTTPAAAAKTVTWRHCPVGPGCVDERLAEEAGLIADGLLPDAEPGDQPAGLKDFLAAAETEMAAAMATLQAATAASPILASGGTAGKRRLTAEQRGDRSSTAAAAPQSMYAQEHQRPTKRAAMQRSYDTDVYGDVLAHILGVQTGEPRGGELSPCSSQQPRPAATSPDCVLVGVSTAADRVAAAWTNAVVISSPVSGGDGSGSDALGRQYPWDQGGSGSVRQTLDGVFGREGTAGGRDGALIWRRSAESSPERSLIFRFEQHKCSSCPGVAVGTSLDISKSTITHEARIMYSTIFLKMLLNLVNTASTKFRCNITLSSSIQYYQ